MPSKKWKNWTKIKTEYVTGNISQRELAAKYGIPYSTLRDRANAEKWAVEREYSRSKIVANAVQKTADKFEQMRGILIDQLMMAIECMPEDGGTHARLYMDDGNKKVTVEYDLLDVVTMYEKLATDGRIYEGGGVKVIIDV